MGLVDRRQVLEPHQPLLLEAPLILVELRAADPPPADPRWRQAALTLPSVCANSSTLSRCRASFSLAAVDAATAAAVALFVMLVTLLPASLPSSPAF